MRFHRAGNRRGTPGLEFAKAVLMRFSDFLRAVEPVTIRCSRSS